MKDDFVRSLGYLGLSVRLKRISESMIHCGRNMYKSLGLDIEPNWFLIFKLLQEHPMLAITEIAEHLRFSHPSVVNLVRKMKERGYLEGLSDANDSRKQLVRLTPKAKEVLPNLEQIWAAGEIGIEKMFDPDDDFLDKLTILENQYRELDFMQRTLNELKNEPQNFSS